MHLEGKYLLVSYRDIPNTDFICEYDGDIRIRVSKVDRLKVKAVAKGPFLGTNDSWVLVFENISNRLIQEQDEIMRAVSWYKSKVGLGGMNLVYI
jgi:hypothetical protein